MNPDFVLSQLRTFTLAAIAYLAGRGIFTPADATFATAAITALGPILVPWAMSVYSTWNIKRIPADSVAAAVATEVLKTENKTSNSEAIVQTATAAAVKAAASLLVGFMLLGLLSQQASAQNKPKPVAILAPAVPQGKVSQNDATKNPLLALQTFTLDDLQAALDDANAQTPPDEAAANCYAALIPIVQAGVANPLPKGLGGFQLLQKLRDAKAIAANIQSPSGPLAKLNIACAPLVLDVQNTLIQLGIVSGGVIASGGLTLPLALPFALPFK